MLHLHHPALRYHQAFDTKLQMVQDSICAFKDIPAHLSYSFISNIFSYGGDTDLFLCIN